MFKKDKIVIGAVVLDNNEASITEALEKSDGLVDALGLTGKNAMHVRLLFEETLGLLKAMTGIFNAEVSFEREGDECRILVNAMTEMNIEKKTELISVSSSGKNAAARGFMGKIADIIETGILGYEEVTNLQQSYGGGEITYGGMGIYQVPSGVTSPEIIWSLNNYRQGLTDAIGDEDGAAKEAWDELEKSIVASIAEDVVVGVKNNKVNLTITYVLS